MFLGTWINPDGRVGWCWIPRFGWWGRPIVGMLPVGGIGALAGLLAGLLADWRPEEDEIPLRSVFAGGETDGIDRVAEWLGRPQTKWSVVTIDEASVASRWLRYDTHPLAEATKKRLAQIEDGEESPAALAAGLAWMARIKE